MTAPDRHLLDDSRHRAEFYRMWAAGHAAGLTHPASLEAMGVRESRTVEDMRQWLLSGTRRGSDLTTLVRAGAARFDELDRALLTLGDESGRLDGALRLLADFHTRKHQLMLWVKKKMVYPVVTLLAACFVAPLPLLVAGHPAAYAATALAGVVFLLFNVSALLAAASARYGRRPQVARARMARALATAVEAGLPLPRAVRLAADAAGHPGIRNFVARIGEQQLATHSLSESLAGCPHLTPDFTAVLATAERTGDFSVVSRLAELYEDGFR